MLLHPATSNGSTSPSKKRDRADLVGRPLVPFFDQEDCLNDQMTVDSSTREVIENVDARVWNNEGYFEYPEEPTKTSPPRIVHGCAPTPANTPSQQESAPVTREKKEEHHGQLILNLLNSGRPQVPHSSTQPFAESILPPPIPTVNILQTANPLTSSTLNRTPRSVSKGRNTKRSETPTGNDAQNTQRKLFENENSASKSNRKNGNGGASSNRSTSNKRGKQQQKHQKQQYGNEDTPSKWAWSSFQSSPDPKSLPFPRFNSCMEEGMDEEDQRAIEEFVLDALDNEVPKAPDHPPPLPRASHPLQTPPRAALTPHSSELRVDQSMTESMKRMLNIG